jgi:hypothetical protein
MWKQGVILGYVRDATSFRRQARQVVFAEAKRASVNPVKAGQQVQR